MKVMEIEGGRDLNGTIRISGAKNATVALIPAAILTDDEATICNIPEITDTEALSFTKQKSYLFPSKGIYNILLIPAIDVRVALS